MRFQNLMLLVICVLPGAMPAMASDDEALQLGQQYTQQFYDKEIGLVWASMTEQMHAALGRESALRQFREKVDGDMGGESPDCRGTYRYLAGFQSVYTHVEIRKLLVQWCAG